MPSQRGLLYAVLIAFICGILANAGMYFYIGHEITENNKRTCNLYQLIFQPTTDSPVPDPEDPEQKRASEIRKEIGKLIETYECEERNDVEQ